MLLYVDLTSKGINLEKLDADIQKAISQYKTEESSEPYQIIGLATEATNTAVTSWMRYTRGYQVLFHPDNQINFRTRAITTELMFNLINAGEHKSMVILSNDQSYTTLGAFAVANGITLTVQELPLDA